VIALSGGLPSLEVFGTVVSPGWVGQGFAAVYLVWLLNYFFHRAEFFALADVPG